MPKIKITERSSRDSITVKTNASKINRPRKWWKAGSQAERCMQLLDTATFLKETQQFRYRQAAQFTKLYSNLPLFGLVGTSLNKLTYNNQLPLDRPTMNVIQSCVDTLVSKLTQSRPAPVFLTDNGDYKARNMAKQMNKFIGGELFQTKAYDIAREVLRDACVIGTGAVKVYAEHGKVKLERRLVTELMVDPNDALYGEPRQLYELKLVDREVLADLFPKERSVVEAAEQSYAESQGDSNRTAADQVMVVEGWHLPSGPDAGDGRHMIACISGSLLDEKWEEDKFPFVWLHYCPRMLGMWGQSLAEQLMGTQIEINKLLMTISQSINLVGVPRVFVEDGSKVVKAHLNSQVGAIVTFKGTKPSYEVAPCVPQELYGQLTRLVEYAYQQSGVSAMSAASQKPAGLDSGEAIREYDDIQSDRFADLNRRYDNMFIDLSYQIIEKASQIAEDEGSYQTVFPNKDGTKEIDLPKVDLVKDPFVIQCYDASSLPKDPAGRLAKITEMIQAGMISVQEGRRLLNYPDLEQNEKLANASEERILQYLDKIVEDGDYTPPDPFMNLQLAKDLSNQYYNLYCSAKLEDDRAEMLRTFNSQAIALMTEATQPPPQAMQPQAAPMPQPQSPLVPNVPGQASPGAQ